MTNASREESDSTQATRSLRIPLSIKVVSLVFYLIGAIVLALSVEQLLAGRVVPFAVAVLAAITAMLTAFGLRRLYNPARILVLVQTWFWLVISFLPTVDALATSLVIGSNDRASEGWQLSALLGSFMYAVWQCRLLHTRRMRELFAASSRGVPLRVGTNPAGRFRFGLKTVFFITLLIAVALARLSVSLYAPRPTSMLAIQSDGSRVQVDYGYRSHRFLNVPERLDYVAFHDTRDLWVAVHHGPGGIGGAYLHKPDGTDVELPNEVQLYEHIDSKYRESRERIEKRQFDAWLASNPGNYSIDALLEYAESHPTEEQ